MGNRVRDKALLSLSGSLLKPTYGGTRQLPDPGEGWWSSDLPQSSSTYVDSSLQMQALQAEAKKPMCESKKAQAKSLTEKCSFHDDPAPSVTAAPFPIFDRANRLGGWNNCYLAKGHRCTVENQKLDCSLASWLLPVITEEHVKPEDTHNHLSTGLAEHI